MLFQCFSGQSRSSELEYERSLRPRLASRVSAASLSSRGASLSFVGAGPSASLSRLKAAQSSRRLCLLGLRDGLPLAAAELDLSGLACFGRSPSSLSLSLCITRSVHTWVQMCQGCSYKIGKQQPGRQTCCGMRCL